MNIRFKSIDIENFRSIKRAYVELENQGTVIVRGVNEYEDKATSNGSGKSSMFEAIIFALFEETSSGEKDVANRIINDGYTINLVFEIDGVEYSILRQCKSGKTSVVLFKNGIDISARNKTDTNKLIIQLIGINKNIFLDSVLLSQGANTNLASLTPTARKERLEVLTNTDVTITKFKDALKERQNEYEAECVNCQMELNKILGRQSALSKQTTDVLDQIAQIEREIAERQASNKVVEIESQIKQLEIEDMDMDQQIDVISVNVDENEKAMENARLKLDEIVKVKDQLEQQRNAKREEYNQLSGEINKAKFDISYEQQTQKRLDKEVEDIKNSDKCPTCGRKYENADEQHIVEVIQQKTQLWNNAQINIDNLNKLVQEKETVLDELAKQGQEINQQIEQIQPEYQQASTMLNEMINKGRTYTFEQTKCYNNKRAIQDKISYLQKEKEEFLKQEVGNPEPLKQLLSKIDEEQESLIAEYDSKQQELNTKNEYVSGVKHSIQLVTKEFRTYLLQNSIQFMNGLLANYSRSLFSNEKDLIHIVGDDAKLNIELGTATYESLSGGEKTRVNIALLLAQKALASSIGNFTCNLIILDEVLGYCDSQAESNVLDLITSELNSLESIYMVSHKEIPVGYDKELIVVKNSTGLSSIKTY